MQAFDNLFMWNSIIQFIESLLCWNRKIALIYDQTYFICILVQTNHKNIQYKLIKMEYFLFFRLLELLMVRCGNSSSSRPTVSLSSALRNTPKWTRRKSGTSRKLHLLLTGLRRAQLSSRITPLAIGRVLTAFWTTYQFQSTRTKKSASAAALVCSNVICVHYIIY